MRSNGVGSPAERKISYQNDSPWLILHLFISEYLRSVWCTIDGIRFVVDLCTGEAGNMRRMDGFVCLFNVTCYTSDFPKNVHGFQQRLSHLGFEGAQYAENIPRIGILQQG